MQNLRGIGRSVHGRLIASGSEFGANVNNTCLKARLCCDHELHGPMCVEELPFAVDEDKFQF